MFKSLKTRIQIVENGENGSFYLLKTQIKKASFGQNK